MQYDIDINGKLSAQFETIRKILLSYPKIQEVENAKQTSYSDRYGVIVMLRTKGDLLVAAFGKGAKLQEKYPQLQGTGKVVRHLYFGVDDEIDEAMLRDMIEESMVLGIEAYEIKRLRFLR